MLLQIRKHNRPLLQLLYFVTVLVIKLLDSNQQYFQVVFSLLLSALSIPFQLILAQYTEQSQYACKLFFHNLTLLCLGTLDAGMHADLLMTTLQYLLLGITLQEYLEKDSRVELNYKIIRVTYIVQVCVALNVSYVIHESATLPGLIGAEFIMGAMIINQINTEIQTTPSKPQSLIESPRNMSNRARNSRDILLDDDNQVHVVPLGQACTRRQLDDHGSGQSNLNLMEQQKNFYKILFNQFPQGMVILSEQDQIEYHNNQIHKLFNVRSKKDILQKLKALRNYQNKFDEQAQFNQLFNMLNQKLRRNSGHSQIIEEEVNESDIGGYSESEYDIDELKIETSNAEGLAQEIERTFREFSLDTGLQSDRSPNVLQRLNSIRSRSQGGGYQEKLRFLKEVKMLCALSEDDNASEENAEGNTMRSWLVEVTIKPFVYESKNQLLVMVRDVSLFNQFNVLSQTNKNKSKMLYQVAHELRTPLNCIVVISQQLMDQFVNRDRGITEKYLIPILSSANQISRLVEDLLDLAQLKAGKFKLNFMEFELEKLLIDLATTMTFLMHSKKLSLDLSFDPMIPKTIKSDQNRIRQIIQNLISNSIKFTSHGGITLNAKLSSQRVIEIELQDTGVGIKEEDLPMLFKAFGKLEETRAINTSGVGLGLMISNIMAQKLGQTGEGLKVQSEGVNKGTRFSFQIYDQNDRTERASVYQSAESRKQIARKESNMSIVIVSKNETKGEPQSASQKYKPMMVAFQSDKKIDIDLTKHYQFHYKEDEDSHRSEYFKKIAKLQHISKSISIKHSQFTSNTNNQSLPQIQRIEDESPTGLEIQRKSFKMCQCPDVLIVDDDQTNVFAVSLIMDQQKFSYEKSYSGIDCILFLSTLLKSDCCQWVKVILMDLEMPGMDGIQTVLKIREMEREHKQQAYIIGCSGHEDPKVKEQCIKAGMDNYVIKPFDRNVLIKLVQSQL